MPNADTTGPTTAGPLCVEPDGGLLATDLFWESLRALVLAKPRTLLALPVWLSRGKGTLRGEVLGRARLDPSDLPYRDDVVAFLRAERAAGRSVVLRTSAPAELARGIADHLGVFDGVIADDPGAKPGAPETPWPTDARPVGRWRAVVKQVRPHQWAKNALLAVPLVTSHQASPEQLTRLALGFVTFSLTASSVYVANDLFDLASDRRHAVKRRRPLASGRLSIPEGLALAGALLVGGLAGACLVSASYAAMLLLYLTVSTLYSLVLKRKLMADVVCLAGLYTFRILTGGELAGVTISPWLLAFSMFFFLSLAFVKRYTELSSTREGRLPGKGQAAHGRGYRSDDVDLILAFGPGSGQLSVLIFCLYLNSPDVLKLYRHPKLLWLVCPLLLYWLGRVWFLARRDAMVHDPVVFALRDRVSYLVGLLTALLILAGTLDLPGRFPGTPSPAPASPAPAAPTPTPTGP